MRILIVLWLSYVVTEWCIACAEMNVWFSYKPVKLSALIEPLKLDFEALVRETFSDLDNKHFLENVEVIIICRLVNWTDAFLLVKC